MTHRIIHSDIIKYLSDYQDVMQRGYMPKYHAVICDPPYYLGGKSQSSGGFMGKSWDGFDSPQAYQAWVTEWASLLLDYVYPGGVLMAFGGTRTYHRLVCGLEDAGWEIYDSIGHHTYYTWNYGSGFPKSTRIDMSASPHLSKGAVCQCDDNRRSNENTYPLHNVLSRICTADTSEQVVNVIENVLRDLNIPQDFQDDYLVDLHSCGELLHHLSVVAQAFSQPQQYVLEHNRLNERDDGQASESLHTLCQALHNDLLTTRDYFPPSASQHVCELIQAYEDGLNPVAYLSMYRNKLAGFATSLYVRDDGKSVFHRLHIHSLVFCLPLNILSIITSNDSSILAQIGVCRKCGKPYSYYSGYGSALKPSFEPIVLARKPRNGYTYAECATQFGSGALNIDGCRIATDETWTLPPHKETYLATRGMVNGYRPTVYTPNDNSIRVSNPQGRWPANTMLTHHPACNDTCHPECHVRVLSEQTEGTRASKPSAQGQFRMPGAIWGSGQKTIRRDSLTDSEENAARFFYQAKAAKWERDAGLDVEEKPTAAMQGNLVNGQRLSGKGEPIKTPMRRNPHPTVKPIQLITELATLCKPPIEDSRILIPFSGSGSEMIGAHLAGWSHITGIEMTDEYIPIARARLQWWQRFNSYAMAEAHYKNHDDSQMTLFETLA